MTQKSKQYSKQATKHKKTSVKRLRSIVNGIWCSKKMIGFFGPRKWEMGCFVYYLEQMSRIVYN